EDCRRVGCGSASQSRPAGSGDELEDHGVDPEGRRRYLGDDDPDVCPERPLQRSLAASSFGRVLVMSSALVKYPLGLLCLAAGGAGLWFDGQSIMLGLAAKSGLHLPQVALLAGGVALIGAAADFFFGRRRVEAPQPDNIAKSVWATRGDLLKAGIAEDAPQANGKEGIYLGEFSDGA